MTKLSNHDFGIHAPVHDDRFFLERDVLDALRRDIAAGRSVLVVGPSMSGKTRLAAEALRAVAQDKDDLEVLLLNDGASPLSFLEHGVPSDGVVWLDDLEGFLACRVDCRARAAAAGRRERHRGHHARS